MSYMQVYGWKDHVKDGHRILYRDCIRGHTKLLIEDPCPFGSTNNIERNSCRAHSDGF